MPNAHVQVTRQVRQGDVPKDYTVNNLYFAAVGTVGSVDWQALTDHVSQAMFSKVGFGGSTPWTRYGGNGGTIKAYDLADPKPRPIKATTVYTPTSWDNSALGPRALALCLSYYMDRNLPHTRGRIYLGPFTQGEANELPQASLLASVMDLAKGISQIAGQGAVSWSHCYHSTVTGLTQAINHYWANDVWDIQHSREHSESVRVKYP